MTIHPVKEAQIAILAKYLDFPDVLLEKLANILSKQIGINKHATELEKNKQPSYKYIYSLGPVEFENFKTYIKTNLANGFIQASKLSVGSPILFICKVDSNFGLCVDYQDFNNLTIKN